jgi:nucleotide-binding universal stress UspA family protein
MKILVGYDGSNASKKALSLAKQHAAIQQGL